MDRTSTFSFIHLGRFSRGRRPRRRLVSPASRSRKRVLASMGVIVIGGLATPATAAPEPSTKLIRCGAQSCLRISGHREEPNSTVRINGHAIAVEGKRNWQVQLPVAVVRAWSAPYARTIEVSLHDPETRHETTASVDLPIGLLGGVTNLASLVVSVR